MILPEVANLKLDTHGDGTPVHLTIRKDAEAAVRIAKEDEPVVGTLLKQGINIWDKFNLRRGDLASKLGLTGPKTSALIIELKIQDDPACFHELTRKSSTFKGYSKKALGTLREAMSNGIDIEHVWSTHRRRFAGRQRQS